MNLGDKLRNLLIERDITQKQLAEHLNIGVSTLGNYMQSTREPDYQTLIKLADYFDVTIDYLLDRKSTQTARHMEGELLRVFRAMTKEQQEIYIGQGKLFVIQNHKKIKFSNSKNSDDKIG